MSCTALSSPGRILAATFRVLARELTQQATSLEQELAELDRLAKTWNTTLEAAKQGNVPVQSLQNALDSIAQRRASVEATRARVLTLLGQISDEETRIRRTLAAVEQSQIQALRDLLVRDSPPIWRLKGGLGSEWQKRSSQSFVSQVESGDGIQQTVAVLICHSCAGCGVDCVDCSKIASWDERVGPSETRSPASSADP